MYGFFPIISFEEKLSYKNSNTKEYDIMAMKYIGIVLIPGLLFYYYYYLLFNYF